MSTSTYILVNTTFLFPALSGAITGLLLCLLGIMLKGKTFFKGRNNNSIKL